MYICFPSVKGATRLPWRLRKVSCKWWGAPSISRASICSSAVTTSALAETPSVGGMASPRRAKSPCGYPRVRSNIFPRVLACDDACYRSCMHQYHRSSLYKYSCKVQANCTYNRCWQVCLPTCEKHLVTRTSACAGPSNLSIQWRLTNIKSTSGGDPSGSCRIPEQVQPFVFHACKWEGCFLHQCCRQLRKNNMLLQVVRAVL